MPERCPVCNQKYELETGFFYGAMYVNYAITIALSIALYVAINVFVDIEWTLFLIIDILLMLILAPYMFKLGRAVWANFFIHYKGVEQKKSGGTETTSDLNH